MMTLNIVVIVLTIVVIWIWIVQLAAKREEDRHWQEWAERLDEALDEEQRDHFKTLSQ